MRQGKGIRPAADVSPFYWDVPKRGFKWTDPPDHNDPPAGRLLVPEGGPVRRYIPLRDVPTLFRVFAGTEPSERGILTFANRYGWLGAARVVMFPSEVVLSSDEGDLRFDRVGFGEDMLKWKEEIAALGEAVHLWTAARTGNPKDLESTLGRGAALAADRDFIGRVGKPTTLGPWPDVAADTRVTPHAEAFATATDRERSPSETELRRLAWFLLEQRLSERLDRLTRPCLIYSDSAQRPRLHVIPKNLLGALWLQFALAVDGETRYRKCSFCKAWICTSSEEGYTAARQFCNDQCRVRAYRQKMKSSASPARYKATAKVRRRRAH